MTEGDECRFCGGVVGHMEEAYVVKPCKVIVADETVVRSTIQGARSSGIVCRDCWEGAG